MVKVINPFFVFMFMFHLLQLYFYYYHCRIRLRHKTDPRHCLRIRQRYFKFLASFHQNNNFQLHFRSKLILPLKFFFYQIGFNLFSSSKFIIKI